MEDPRERILATLAEIEDSTSQLEHLSGLEDPAAVAEARKIIQENARKLAECVRQLERWSRGLGH